MTLDEVSYTSRWEDVLAANRLRLKPARTSRVTWALLAVIGVGEIALALADPKGRGMLLIGLGMLSCLAYPTWWLVLHRWLLPRLARRYHQQAPSCRSRSPSRGARRDLPPDRQW